VRLALFILLLIPSSSWAATLTNCIPLQVMDHSITISSATHIEVGSWHEDTAGCDPTGERARPTNGTYSVTYFADGSEVLTFLRDSHETCGRTQNDVRWRGADGLLYRYADFVVNAGVDCYGGVRVTTEDRLTPSTVPEPSTFVLFASMMTVVWMIGRRIP
jgi:hypothetical protein